MSDPTRFIGDLVIRAIPHWEIPASGRRRSVQLYEVRERFTFVSREFGAITVGKGFVTDFASVPVFSKFIIDDDDPDILFASLPHDWLYRTAGMTGGSRVLTRYESDCVLYEAMIAAGAPSLKASIVFRAVRIGGGGAWRS